GPCPAQSQQSEQRDQWQRTRRRRQLIRRHLRRLGRLRNQFLRWRRGNHLGEFHLFSRGLNRHDRRPLQFHDHRLARRLVRLRNFHRKLGRGGGEGGVLG